MSFTRAFLSLLSSRFSVADAATRLGIPRRGGRYYCPLCQPGGPAEHKTPDLSISDRGFHCFKCGISGGDAVAFLQRVQKLDFPDAVRQAADFAGIPLEETPDRKHRGDNRDQTASAQGFSEKARVSYGERQKKSVPAILGGTVHVQEHPELRPDLLPMQEQLIQALPGSPGEEYLHDRGFSLGLAQSYGIGYATPDVCRRIGLDRQTPPVLGRLVFPHYCPTGKRNGAGQMSTGLCSLYGRAVELKGKGVAKEVRHRHLSGAKGWFNCGTVDAVGFAEPLILCEGSFDALAWIAAGHPRTLATYGAHVNRLDWLRGVRSVLISFDFDPTGRTKAEEFAQELSHRGKEVFMLDPTDLSGAKDPAEAWAQGKLSLDILQG